MDSFSRRTLLGAAATVAASAVLSDPVHAQFVWQKRDWHSEEFEKLVSSPRRIKLVIHAKPVDGGRFLNNARSGLNGFRYGHDLRLEQVQLVVATNGPANMVNYDDEAWRKYRIGQFTQVQDPKTGEPALRNIFHPKKASYSSEDPSSEDSLYQDASVEALQGRGVRFVSCHTATEEAARVLIKQNSLTADPEEVTRDLISHALPGVVIVPALTAALAILQTDGHYGYMAA